MPTFTFSCLQAYDEHLNVIMVFNAPDFSKKLFGCIRHITSNVRQLSCLKVQKNIIQEASRFVGVRQLEINRFDMAKRDRKLGHD